MKLEDIFEKARILKDDIKEFISSEHTISLSNEHLSRYRKQIAEALQARDIQDGKLSLRDGCVHVEGRIAKGGGGRFEADLVPAGVIWEEGSHALLFQIARQNVTMDKKLANILAASATRISSALFGADFLNRKMGVVDEEGRIRVPLDGQSQTMDALVGSLEVKSLHCEDERLYVTFQPRPKEAMRNAKSLMSWWKDRILSRGGTGD